MSKTAATEGAVRAVAAEAVAALPKGALARRTQQGETPFLVLIAAAYGPRVVAGVPTGPRATLRDGPQVPKVRAAARLQARDLLVRGPVRPVPVLTGARLFGQTRQELRHPRGVLLARAAAQPVVALPTAACSALRPEATETTG